MNAMYDWLVLGAALVAAVGLGVLGVRRLPRPWQRRGGRFAVAVTAFLVLLNEAAPDDEPPASPATPAQAAPQAVVPAELAAEGKWLQFKKLWRELNERSLPASEPPPRPPVAAGPTGTPVPPADVLRARQEERSRWLGAVYEAFGLNRQRLLVWFENRPLLTLPPRPDGGQWSLLGAALFRLSVHRVDTLWPPPLAREHVFLHCMPPPPPPAVGAVGTIIPELERRLDTLLALRAEGKIGGAVFAQALDNAAELAYVDLLTAELAACAAEFSELSYARPLAADAPIPALAAERWSPYETAPVDAALATNAAAWERGFTATCQRLVAAQEQRVKAATDPAAQAQAQEDLTRLRECQQRLAGSILRLAQLRPRLVSLLRELER